MARLSVWTAAPPWAGVAGWPSRALSAVVDQTLCAAILAPVAVIGGIVGVARMLLAPAPMLGEGLGLVGATAVWTGIVALVTGPYYVIGERRAVRQTLGKTAAGIRVVDAVTAGRITTGQALVRWLVRLVFWVPVPMLTLGIGLIMPVLDVLWPLWNERNQALHDKLAGTIVVSTNG